MKKYFLLTFLNMLIGGCAHDAATHDGPPVCDKDGATGIDRAFPVMWLEGFEFKNVSLEDVVAAINTKIKTQTSFTNVMLKLGPNISGSMKVSFVLGRSELKSVVKVFAGLTGLSVRIEKEKNGQILILFIEGQSSGVSAGVVDKSRK